MKAFFTDEQWLPWIDALAQNDVVEIEDFISPQTLGILRAFLLHKWQSDAFEQAKIGSNVHDVLKPDIRGDYTYWLHADTDTALAPVFDLIKEGIAMLNKYCFLSLSGFEFHLAHYPANAFYKRHFDRFKDKSNRMLSVVIYLNEHWEASQGGQLRLYNVLGKPYVDVSPVACKAVIFKSDVVEHEVLPTTASRFSLTGWLLYQPSTVGGILV